MPKILNESEPPMTAVFGYIPLRCKFCLKDMGYAKSPVPQEVAHKECFIAEGGTAP